MSESTRMWVEIVFNIAYLAIIWGIVISMARRQPLVELRDRAVASRFLWAFALLALGDTGHVGFRVIAYALGGLEANPTLVGIGALSTAYTITLFYMLMVAAWVFHFKKRLAPFGLFLLLVGVARLVLMAFPQNQWHQLVAPYTWSLIRNGLLAVMGFGVIFLFLKDAIRTGDRPFLWLGILIILSFAFYAPVILWSAQNPMLGMLMIPKTLAYLGMAFVAYRAFYSKARRIDLRAK